MSLDRSAFLQYLLYREKTFATGKILSLSDFAIMGWDTDNYQVYAMNCANQVGTGIHLCTLRISDPTAFYAIPQTPIYNQATYDNQPYFVPDWVKKERTNLSPFTHYAGGIRSLVQYTPPFHVQMVVDIPYVYGLLPSIWCYHCEQRTEEFDFFETNERDIWMAHNFTFLPNWDPATRECNASHLWWCPKGEHQIDFELTSDTALWYLDGHRIKLRRGEFNLPYFLLATLIVTKGYCPETTMKIKRLSIEQ